MTRKRKIRIYVIAGILAAVLVMVPVVCHQLWPYMNITTKSEFLGAHFGDSQAKVLAIYEKQGLKDIRRLRDPEYLAYGQKSAPDIVVAHQKWSCMNLAFKDDRFYAIRLYNAFNTREGAETFFQYAYADLGMEYNTERIIPEDKNVIRSAGGNGLDGSRFRLLCVKGKDENGVDGYFVILYFNEKGGNV